MRSSAFPVGQTKIAESRLLSFTALSSFAFARCLPSDSCLYIHTYPTSMQKHTHTHTHTKTVGNQTREGDHREQRGWRDFESSIHTQHAQTPIHICTYIIWLYDCMICIYKNQRSIHWINDCIYIIICTSEEESVCVIMTHEASPHLTSLSLSLSLTGGWVLHKDSWWALPKHSDLRYDRGVPGEMGSLHSHKATCSLQFHNFPKQSLWAHCPQWNDLYVTSCHAALHSHKILVVAEWMAMVVCVAMLF